MSYLYFYLPSSFTSYVEIFFQIVPITSRKRAKTAVTCELYRSLGKYFTFIAALDFSVRLQNSLSHKIALLNLTLPYEFLIPFLNHLLQPRTKKIYVYYTFVTTQDLTYDWFGKDWLDSIEIGNRCGRRPISVIDCDGV